MLEIEIQIKRIPRRKALLSGELWVVRSLFKVQEKWIERGG